MTPDHINPVQWTQSLGLARQACARIFRDGGVPRDALTAFGLQPVAEQPTWDRTVEQIAQFLCATPMRRAA